MAARVIAPLVRAASRHTVPLQIARTTWTTTRDRRFTTRGTIGIAPRPAIG